MHLLVLPILIKSLPFQAGRNMKPLYQFVLYLVFALELVAAQNLHDALSQDGSVNDKYEFFGGKYFLKEDAKQDMMMSAMGVSAQIYSQCLDHTQNPCTQTFSQRFWQNDAYYKPGGPIFFYIGAEGPMDGCADNYANQYLWYGAAVGAKMVCIEHRFYGSSYPTNDQTAAGLRLLTSQQALADYIQFLRWFKAREGVQNAKVVVFGGSYGGDLAAWIRELYPRDITVSVSSSGPLNATFDMFQYVQVVSESIYNIDSNCYDALNTIFDCMQNVALGIPGCSASVKTANQLPSAVNYCYNVDFNNKHSRENFWVTTAFSVWASNYPVTQDTPQCAKLLTRYNANRADPIAVYGQFLRDIGKTWGNCGAGRKRSENIGTLSAATDMKSWIWQTCNEFGFYQSSDPTYSLFGSYTWSASYWANHCRSNWGSGYTDTAIQSKIAKTQGYYKGQAFYGTCTIFVNGKNDPWHKLSIYDASQTTTKNSVVLIPTGEHCSDMSHGGSADVQQAQNQIQTLIGKYLADFTC